MSLFPQIQTILTPFKFLASRAPSLGCILNRRFFYCIYVNTLMFLLFLWLTTGGGDYEFLNITAFYILKHIIFNAVLFFCLFYLLAFLPFGIVLERSLCILYFLIGIVDIFLSLTFQTQLNSIFFMMLLSTNATETREFLEFYTSFKLLITLLAFILSSLVFLPTKFYTFLLHPISALFTHKANQTITFTLFLLGNIIAGQKIYSITTMTLLTPFLTDKNSALRWYFTITDSLITQNSFIREFQNIARDLSTHTARESIPRDRTIPNIVLIIGESTQRNLMSLYGYALPTTPKLDALRDAGDLIVFSDTISPAASTNASLQKVLTFSNYENSQIPWYRQPNLIDTLRLAGYTTHWLSNQEIISVHSNSPALIAGRSNEVLFASKNDSFTTAKLSDGILLPMLDQLLARISKETTDFQNSKESSKSISPKNQVDFIDSKKIIQPLKPTKSPAPHFYAIHLMGAHPAYYQRYPRSFSRFSARDLQKYNLDYLPNVRKLTESELDTKAQYLNAIAYNDLIVSEIFKRFKEKNAIVFYLSDHGQEVYDVRDFAGHSSSRFGVEIPFVIYMSESFKHTYPEVMKKVEEARDKPFMSDDFIHSLLDLAGIKAKDVQDSRSVFSPSFNNSRPRIIDGKDYDNELKR